MKQSLKYFFSICLGLFFFVAEAQNSTASEKETASPKNLKPATKDSIAVKTDRYGLILGVEVNKLLRSLYDEDYKGIGFVGNYRLTKKYYLAAGIGNENITVDGDQIDFTTKGSYLKAGFDYNTYNNWLDMENLITIGVKYGFSTFNQELNSYDVYHRNPYFSETPSVVSGQEYNGLTASWAEVAAGVNVKVFNNVYVGFNLQLKVLITNVEPDNFSNLFIPGFGQTHDGDFGAGFNYTVSYFVPIYKKKVKPVEITKNK